MFTEASIDSCSGEMMLTVLGRGEGLIDQTHDSITTLLKKDHACRSTTYLLSGDRFLANAFFSPAL